jgi:hypothetical protein
LEVKKKTRPRAAELLLSAPILKTIGVSRFQFPARPIFNIQPLNLQKPEIGRWKLEKERSKIARYRIDSERGDLQNHRRLALPITGSLDLLSPIFNLQAPGFNLQASIFNR